MTARVSARMRACSIAPAAAVLLLFSSPLHAQDATHAASAPEPQKLWAAQTSASGITLNWGALSGVLGYLLHCASGDEPPRLVGRPASNANQWHLQVGAGMQGVVQRCFLQAQTAKGLSGMVAFNPVVPAKAAAAPAAPASVTATQSAPDEITLTWTEVPGATAYFLARSVGNDGYRVLCQLCPVTPTYLDRDVATGVRYSYAVAAVSPGGTSRRTSSNALTTESAIALGDDDATSGAPAGGSSTGGSTPTGGSSTGGSTPTGGSSTGGGSGGSGWTPGGTGTGGTPGGTPGGTGTGGSSSPAGVPGPDGSGTATPVQPCVLEYQRADNMWAAYGRPDGDLGTEKLTLQPGQRRSLVTDWRYEKTRNDGANYYGSHTRVVKNAGARPVRIRIFGSTSDNPLAAFRGAVQTIKDGFEITLDPGVRQEMKADLQEVFCSEKS